MTKAQRDQITDDWLTQFPGLGRYEPLDLLRRVGPLVQGIGLDLTSGNRAYRPTFHVHSLLRPSPTVSAILYHRLRHERSGSDDSVDVGRHAQHYQEAARRLERQSPLPLVGDLRLEQVLTAYSAFAARPGRHFDADLLYEDMAAYCAWLGDVKRAAEFVATGYAELAKWSAEALLDLGGREQWRDRVARTVADSAALRATMDEQIKKLRLEALPVCELLA